MIRFHQFAFFDKGIKMTQKRVLMCPPDYYGIEYEINPWMDKSRQPDRSGALGQWLKLKCELEKAGLIVVLVPSVRGLPDMVFTANAGLVSGMTVILSRFRHTERCGEIERFQDYFYSIGYECATLPRVMYFEGEGDALFCGERLVCGYGFRSDADGARSVAGLLGKEPVLLKLVDPYFYHLDTCFSYPKENLVMCYLPAFDQASQKKIEQIGEVIPVSEFDAKNFVCNAVPVGKKLITSPMSSSLRAILEHWGIMPLEVRMSEFIKAGGAAKCLTLWI